MARRKNGFQFDSRSYIRYPWDKWTNGETWEVKQGTDFLCTPESFVVYLYHKAKDLGCKVQTRTLKPEGKPVCVVFRFYDEPKVRRKRKK